MISHSESFDRLRRESQRHIDFVVLVCAAIPQVAHWISTGDLTDAKMLPPDHFKGVTLPDLASSAPHYQSQLARASVVTLFSYFESYVHDLLEEIVKFHGGDKTFIATADRRTRAFLAAPPPAILKAKRKLQEPAKKALVQKYKKYTDELKVAGFRFPSELMASTGVRILVKRASAKGFKAWEIVPILEDVLHYPLAAHDKAQFEKVRTLRNDIAHGTTRSVAIKDAMQATKYLHGLAAQIDRHAVEHFFVLESYA